MLPCSMSSFCDLYVVLSIVYFYHLLMMLRSNMRTTIVLYAAGRKALRRGPRRAYLAFEIIGFRGCPRPVGRPSGLGLGEAVQPALKRRAVALQDLEIPVEHASFAAPLAALIQCRIPRGLRAPVSGRAGRTPPAHALISNRAAEGARGSGA